MPGMVIVLPSAFCPLPSALCYRLKIQIYLKMWDSGKRGYRLLSMARKRYKGRGNPKKRAGKPRPYNHENIIGIFLILLFRHLPIIQYFLGAV
jgi:hypothetical protein